MQAEIRIVIADDHPVFRRGLRAVIETDPKLKIVAEAEDGEVALEQIRTYQPDIAILDVKMPNRNGFEVMQATATSPETSANQFSVVPVEPELRSGLERRMRPS